MKTPDRRESVTPRGDITHLTSSMTASRFPTARRAGMTRIVVTMVTNPSGGATTSSPLGCCDRRRSPVSAASGRVGCFPDLSEQHLRNFGAGYRSAEVIPLHLDARLSPQDIQLFLR